MALIPLDLKPDARRLRQFAAACVVFLGVAWPALLALHGHVRAAAAVAGAGLALGAIGWAWPAFLRPLWIGLILVSWPIGFVVTNVALALIYFVVITPIALLLRLAGRDALQLNAWREGPTAWRARKASDMARYLKQY